MSHTVTDIAILNERQGFQKKELDLMKDEFKEFKGEFRGLSDSVRELTKSFNSIKWLAIGCALFYLVQELGFTAVLRTIML